MKSMICMILPLICAIVNRIKMWFSPLKIDKGYIYEVEQKTTNLINCEFPLINSESKLLTHSSKLKIIRYHNGVAETINHHIKSITKAAYAYHDFERFRKRSMLIITYGKDM